MEEQSLLGIVLTSKSMEPTHKPKLKMSLLPSDFWDSLQPADFNKELYLDKISFELSHDSHRGFLNVRTKRDNKLEKPKYHVLITNNEVYTSRESFQNAPLDNPDYLVSARTFDDFNQALSMHHAALYRLHELGF